MKSNHHSRKHQLCNKLLNQIQLLSAECQSIRDEQESQYQSHQVQDPELQKLDQELNRCADKVHKIVGLNEKLEADEQRLKLEYIMLLKEKHTFVNKLKAIQNLGNNLDWDDQSGILQKIQPLIEATKKRLKDSRGTTAQGNKN